MTQAQEQLLTVPDAAQLLGKHPNTIRRWIYAGLLPAKKVGKYGRFMIRKSDLEDAVEYQPPGVDEDRK